MTRMRRLSWSLVATTAAVVLLVTPQAQADHLPGVGHDNNVPAGFGTGLLCNVADTCLLSYNSNNSYAAVGVVGKHTSFTGGGGPAPYSAGVLGETNSQGSSAVGVFGRVAVGGQPGVDSAGVRGENSGIYATAAGVAGYNSGAGYGVRAFSELGTAVRAETNGSSNSASGVYASSYAASTTGVSAYSTYGTGLKTESLFGTALQVNGKATVTGPATFQSPATFQRQATFQNGVAVNGKSTWSRSGVLTLASPADSVTKSGVSLGTGSYVLATMQTDTPGVFVTSAVPNPAASTITINFNATAPAGTKVAWFVVN
jgi:hypothetical protein